MYFNHDFAGENGSDEEKLSFEMVFRLKYVMSYFQWGPL